MRAIVAGGAGFVGTNLIKRLLKDGYQVISLDNYSTGFKENEQGGCDYLEVDITDGIRNNTFFDKKQHGWISLYDVDVIFHMAALPRIKPSFENPEKVCDVNVSGTQNILEYAKVYDTPVIYAGSSSFHGGVYKNPYTFSKWQGEELCKMYERIYGLSVTICRFYNVYGDYMPTEGEYRTVLPIFLEQYKNGESLTITGDGEQRRDFTHVNDVVDAMIKIVELKEYGNTFELGRGKNHSINEVVDMFGERHKENRVHIDKVKGEARETLCEATLAREKLNWKPKLNLKDWIDNKLEDK